MTKALADTIARVIDIPLVSDDAVTLLMRHLLTGDTATLVGVPAASTVGSYAMGGITVALRAASLLREGVGDEIPLVHGVTAWFGQRLLTRIARLDRGGERRLFNLPESLQDAWTRR
jgi:hypothetical protein